MVSVSFMKEVLSDNIISTIETENSVSSDSEEFNKEEKIARILELELSLKDE